MRKVRMMAAVVALGMACSARAQTPPNVWTGAECGDGVQVPAAGIPGVCVPDAGRAFIELVDATTNTWRIAGSVTDLDYLTICAPEGAGIPFNLSAVDLKYTNTSSPNNSLRLTIWGQVGRYINQVGAITQRAPSTNGKVYIRAAILNDQMRGWNGATNTFDSGLLAPVTVHHIEWIRANNSIRINARVAMGHGSSNVGIKSLHGSIIGYIGGPDGAENGSQPGGGQYASLLPLEAPEGSIGDMNAPASNTIINAGAGSEYGLIRAAGFNGCTNFGVANSDWARVDEFVVSGNVKGNLWLKSIGTATAPNPGLDASTSGWESNPRRPAFQVGGVFDGVLVTGSATTGGIFGQVIMGGAGPVARISINGDVFNTNAAANALALPHHGKTPAELGDGAVGGAVAVGPYGVVSAECVPAGTATTPGTLVACDYLGVNPSAPVLVRLYGMPVANNPALRSVIVERDDAPPASLSGARWTDVSNDFDVFLPTVGAGATFSAAERTITLRAKSGVWYPGRTYRVRPDMTIPSGQTAANLRSLWLGVNTSPLTPSMSRGTDDWRYTFWVSGCFADMGKQGGIAGGDGYLDNNDFIVFINWFFNADQRADMARQGGTAGGDGLYDNNDFVVFIDSFFSCAPPTCRVEDGTVYVAVPEMWEGN